MSEKYADKVLSDLADQLQKESNKKVKKAMQLFIKIDMDMKLTVLYASGFKGEVTAKNLREHFDTMDLMDTLDSAIFDMQDDLDSSKELTNQQNEE